MNKCYGCKHYREWANPPFTPMELCTRRSDNLAEANIDFKNRNSNCAYYVGKFKEDPNNLNKALIGAIKQFKKLNKTLVKLNKEEKNMKRHELKVFRVTQKLSQQEMADKLQISVGNYNMIENGKSNGSLEFWKRLQQEFDLDGGTVWNLQNNLS